MKLTSKEYTGKQLLNPQREYVSSAATDIRATFARIKAEQAEQAKQPKNVRKIR